MFNVEFDAIAIARHSPFRIHHSAFRFSAPMTEAPIPPASVDVPKESPRTILFQFVVFPLGIVLVGVGIFLLFGRLASEQHTVPEYVNEIPAGGQPERWQ